MKRRVLIVGAGGWGREVLDMMQASPACGRDWTLGGFLDDRPGILDGLGCPLAIVGDPAAYEPAGEDVFVVAIGAPQGRRRYIRPLRDKGAVFIPFGTDLYQGSSVRIGQGCVFAYQVQIGANATVGDFANVQTLSVIGHDARIGQYAHIGTMAFVGGGARIGDGALVHTHATVIPGVKVGEGATVGAGAVVVKNVPAGATVFGNPAKIIFQGKAD